jgi:hypothetical protein
VSKTGRKAALWPYGRASVDPAPDV